ncbi:EspA/EspE family type VII secretion system effector [Mycobacterium sp. 050134]|uniref:EspA/EspE family type VII secretion system effector n=1 Tax=Mycobacterium sp. 050134 TaxID=3096111 RepID=UPI002EDAE1C6
MNALADAARIIGNLATLGSQFIGLDADLTPPGLDSGGGGESLAAGVTGMTGSIGGMLSSRAILNGLKRPAFKLAAWDRNRVNKLAQISKWEKSQKWLHNNIIYDAAKRSDLAYRGKLLRIDPDSDAEIRTKAANTSPVVNILPWTISVVGYMEWLLGLSPPEDGGDLVSGSQRFAVLAGQLQSARPNQDWQGTGSQAYGEFGAALQETALKLATLDAEFADVVKSQGEWVTHMRLGFGILVNILTAAIFVEVAIRMTWWQGAGEVIAKIFAITVSGLAITVALGMLSTAAGLSVEHAKKADELTSRYQALMPPAASESMVSRVAAGPGGAVVAGGAAEVSRSTGRRVVAASGPADRSASSVFGSAMPTLAQLRLRSLDAPMVVGRSQGHSWSSNLVAGPLLRRPPAARRGDRETGDKSSESAAQPNEADTSGAVGGAQAGQRSYFGSAPTGVASSRAVDESDLIRMPGESQPSE